MEKLLFQMKALSSLMNVFHSVSFQKIATHLWMLSQKSLVSRENIFLWILFYGRIDTRSWKLHIMMKSILINQWKSHLMIIHMIKTILWSMIFPCQLSAYSTKVINHLRISSLVLSHLWLRSFLLMKINLNKILSCYSTH